MSTYYHTNQKGIYPTRGDEIGWGKRYGYIRGWVRTDINGEYLFYTLKPGTYLNRIQPAHIHLTILEPDGRYYWIGNYFLKMIHCLLKREKSLFSPWGGSSGV